MLKIYQTFYRFLLKYKWQYVLFNIALVALSITSSIQPYFYKLFVDQLTAADPDQINLLFPKLLTILLIYLGVRVLEAVLDIATYFLGDQVLFAANRDARLTVFRHIQRLDFAFHLSKSTGSLISIIKRGDSAFFNIFHRLNIEIPRIIINFFIILIFFTSIRWEITAFMIASFLINLLLARYLIAYNLRTRAEFNQIEDHISDLIVDNLINYETVKLFAKENWEFSRLKKEFRTWIAKFWKFANSFRLIDVTVGTAGNLGLFVILLLSLQYTSQQQFTPGEFILILGFVSSFYPRFFELLFKFRDLAKNHTDIVKYFDILDHQVLIKDPVKPIKKSHVAGEIEFKNVTFTYPEAKKPTLKNFSLKIRQGQSVALVGSSGVGKTTVVKLLMRFYDVDQGQILIDDINVNQFTKSQLRSFMGIVPQEPILFNNTVAFNIGYGINKPTKKQITAAAKLANLRKFILSLPKKYHTMVGERGVKLSGGQKQRLAIARMILSNPDIIVFDEATSQLDSHSEKLIQDAFWKAAQDKTTIIIAHRLSTITRADQIVVMQYGKVAEKGSHQDLLQRKESLYQKFWQLQTRKQ